MAKVIDVLNYLESIAPSSMAEEWDNVGLLCGRKEKQVRRVLVALDPFRNVIDEAIAQQTDLIVTHHPLIFREKIMAVNEETETGRCLLTLMENGIAAINAHTNLDMAPGGVNDTLAAVLGLREIRNVEPVGYSAELGEYGLLRMGTVAEQSLETFLAQVKKNLKCDGLRYVNGGKPVCNVAVGGGSCASEMHQVLRAGCDTFVTADVKYNQFRSAYEAGLNMIDAGHFHTENPVVAVLAEKLQAKFPEVEVKICDNHWECMKFFG